ncbi:MAG: hypothetical protein GY917_21290, partial [Planctomycetaceae bacterium]|nr:hypothetical protein [Planctomycetaceae bacterium]
EDVHIRFRPSFFPFTEPSVEVDYLWNDQWIEFGGAGMVDPNVLTAVGYDPSQVNGSAFGLGVERSCMRRHGITAIRAFYKNDIRCLHQLSCGPKPLTEITHARILELAQELCRPGHGSVRAREPPRHGWPQSRGDRVRR